MLIIFGLVVLALAVMLAAPDSASGRALRRSLVEAPARALNRLRRGKIVFFLLLAAAGLMLALLFKADGVRLFGLMLPDLMVWFAVFDVGVFIDALLIAGAVLGANGLSVVRARVSALSGEIVLFVRRRAARQPRLRPARSRPTRKAVDDERPGWADQAVGCRAFSMA